MNTNTDPVINTTPKIVLQSNKAAKWFRLIALFAILAYVTYEAIMHQILGGGKAPSAHALCPLGALESLYSLLFTGNFIQKIFSGTLVLFVLTVALALLFRRSFCGVLCPFGALQELFARIGIKIFKKHRVIPVVIDKPLRYLKYILLVLTVVMAWIYGSLWMAPYDPYSAYGHITAVAASITEDPATIVGFVLLAVTIIGSLLYDRFFCKYLCPMGGLYAIIGKLSPTKVERNKDVCISCGLCTKACPMNIDVAKAEKITYAECINCNECVLACPKKGALDIKFARMKIHPLAFLALVLTIFFGVVLIAQATGFYNVLPQKLEGGAKMAISDVMGYYSIEDTSKATGLSIAEVYQLLRIPTTVPANTMMKNISQSVPGYDFDAAKEAAAEVGASQPAADNNNSGVSPAASQPVATNSAAQTTCIDVSRIKGSMTIMEVAAELKIDVKDVYKLFKVKETVPAQTAMKDIINCDPTYDFHAIKTSLQ